MALEVTAESNFFVGECTGVGGSDDGLIRVVLSSLDDDDDLDVVLVGGDGITSGDVGNTGI